MKKLIVLFVLFAFLLMPGNVFAAFTAVNIGPTTDFNGDINVPSAKGYYINGVQISSTSLSNAATIAMLNEDEKVIGNWYFDKVNLEILSDSADYAGDLNFYRGRDGTPTSNVANNDALGFIWFAGLYNDYVPAAGIICYVDGAPGVSDMPGRLEFHTTPDGNNNPLLRQVIDNAGNIKMGDGAWTNYANVNNAGVLTFEGTASINEPLSILAATTSAELAGVISDETGTDKLVYSDAPTFTGNIKRSVQAGITAYATGGQANAVAITKDVAEISVCATAADSVKLPTAVAGLVIFITNHGAAAADVFPNADDAINEAAANAAKSLGVDASMMCIAYDDTNWECLTLAR